jgi:mannose-6-phosphate isomerase-like protein (cupin superfamily)
MGLKVVKIKDVQAVHQDGGRANWLLVSENTIGAQNLAMGVNETQPGGFVPEHVIETAEEVMYFLSGTGQFISKEQVVEIEPGMCIYSSPGTSISIKNTGKEVLKFIWIITPQLPKHRN